MHSEDKHDTFHMAGLGAAICSYNMLGIWIHVGKSKQFLEVGTKKKGKE